MCVIENKLEFILFHLLLGFSIPDRAVPGKPQCMYHLHQYTVSLVCSSLDMPVGVQLLIAPLTYQRFAGNLRST